MPGQAVLAVEAERLEPLQQPELRIEVEIVVDEPAAVRRLRVEPLPGRAAQARRLLAAFDHPAQLGVAGVGHRQDGEVEQRREPAHQHAGEHHRHRQPVEAHAESLGRRDLARPRQEAEGDERREQDHDRRDGVDDLEREVLVVLDHHFGLDLVLEHEARELGQVDDDVEHDRRAEHDQPDLEESAQDVAVEAAGEEDLGVG